MPRQGCQHRSGANSATRSAPACCLGELFPAGGARKAVPGGAFHPQPQPAAQHQEPPRLVEAGDARVVSNKPSSVAVSHDAGRFQSCAQRGAEPGHGAAPACQHNPPGQSCALTRTSTCWSTVLPCSGSPGWARVRGNGCQSWEHRTRSRRGSSFPSMATTM